MKKDDVDTLKLLAGLGVFWVILMVMMGIMGFFETLEAHNPALVVPVMILLVIVVLIVIVLIVYLVLRYKAKAQEAEARKAQAKATERILNTPLEKFSDSEGEFENLEDLEEKYAEAAGVEPPRKAADARGSSGGSSKGAGRCSRCGTPLEFKGQTYCQKCGAKFVTTVHVPKTSETPVRPQQAGPAPQSPDASLNSQDINSVQYS